MYNCSEIRTTFAMLYSHSVGDSNLLLFTLFLNKLINGDTKYKDTVDGILSDAHQIVLGKKSYYQVDKSYLPIILHLLKVSDKNYLAKIDPTHIDINQYKRVLNYLKS